MWRGGGEAEEGERRRWRKGEGEEGEAREWEGRRGEEGEAREGARRRRDRQTDRQVVIYGGEEGKGGHWRSRWSRSRGRGHHCAQPNAPNALRYKLHLLLIKL